MKRSTCAWPLFVAALVASAPSARAAIQVDAGLARRSIEVGEVTTLRVVVRGATASASAPEFTVPPGLEVLSTGRSQNFTAGDGKSSVEFVYRFEISANAPGRYTLGPVVVHAGKENFRSELLALEATAASTRISGATRSRGAASLLVDVIPAHPWVGQPCHLRVRLILRGSLAEDPQYTPPTAPGFWTDKTGPPQSYYADERGNRVLVTETRTRIYPLSAGQPRVSEAVASLVLAGPDAHREVVVRSPRLVVPVSSLPPGAPAGFSGAVGSVTPRWTADRTRTSAGVTITLRLDLRGVANLPLLRPPSLEGTDFDVFSSTVDESLAAPGSDGVGRKRIEWTVLPRHIGRIAFSPPALAWFDPAAGAYRSADLPAVTVEVGPALDTGAGGSSTWPSVFSGHSVDPDARHPEPWAWSLAGLLLGGGVALWRGGFGGQVVGRGRGLPLEWLRAVGRTHGPDFWRAAEEASAWLGERGQTVESLRRNIATARYAGEHPDEEPIRRQLVERISAALPPRPATGARRAAAALLAATAVFLCVILGPRAGDGRARGTVRAADEMARTGDVSGAREMWAAMWKGGARHPGLAARLAWADARRGAVGPSSAWVVRGERAGVRDPALGWIADRVHEEGGLVGDAATRWPVRPIEWAIAGLLFGVAAGALWPRRGPVALAVLLTLACGAIEPVQRALEARSLRAVVQQTVTLEGAGLDLQPGQVIELLERQGERARVSAGGGVGGWLPDSTIDVVRGES